MRNFGLDVSTALWWLVLTFMVAALLFHGFEKPISDLWLAHMLHPPGASGAV